MKNRDYKEFTPHEIYHVYNRGNNKEKIFLDKNDYLAFISRIGLSLGISDKILSNHIFIPGNRIRINSKPNLFRIHAFCLMPNHFHFLIEQTTDVSISNFILKLCTSYSMYFNKKYQRVGNVFQDCFKAVNVKTNPQLMWTSAYIHMNPVVSELVNDPGDYEWSSYKDFVGQRKLPIVSFELIPQIFDNIKKFMKETKVVLKKDIMSRVPLGFFDVV